MTRQITPRGNSYALTIDRVMQEISGIRPNEVVNVKCSKNKIVISKIKPEEVKEV